MQRRSSHHSHAREPLVRVFAARAARTAFGGVLVGGAVAVVGALLVDPLWSARLLVGSLPLAALVALVVRVTAPALGPSLARRQLPAGGAPSAPVSLMASPSESWTLRSFAGHLELPSYALPIVGLALVAPLTLHAPIVLLEPDGMRDLGRWISLSVVLVGFAHVTLAALGFAFARRLYAGTLSRSPAREGFVALNFTVLASCVPGIIAFVIPPILVAFTGLLFVPACFVVIAAAQRRERALLAEHQRAEAI